MGSSVSYFAEIQTPNDKYFPQVITCEDILKVLLEAFTIASDPNQEFLCKERELQCLYRKYQCVFDEYSPLFFQFVKNAYGYQLLMIIGKVQEWWVNLVAYETPVGWTVLPGSPIRKGCDDCNKFQYAVTKNRCLPDEWEKYECRKGVINNMIKNCTFDYGPNTLIDYRTKPCIQILEPCNKAKVSCEFWLKVSTLNWRLQDHGKNYKIFIDNCEYETVFTDEMILVRLHGQCKGWKKLTVKLFDECGRYARTKQSIWIKLCTKCDCDGKPDCSSSSSSSDCCSSSSSSHCGCSSSSSSSCSSSSSSSCDCRGNKKKKHHKCCSSSSSSSCSSSSSSSHCSSSSSESSEPCESFSKEKIQYYNFQQSYSCPESSSSSEIIVRCGNGCDESQVVCQKRKFKCSKLACGNVYDKH